MYYHRKAKNWLMTVGNSPIFTVSACNQLAEWIEKADKYDRLSKDGKFRKVATKEVNPNES